MLREPIDIAFSRTGNYNSGVPEKFHGIVGFLVSLLEVLNYFLIPLGFTPPGTDQKPDWLVKAAETAASNGIEIMEVN